jgi:hypothetical protein
VFLEKDYDQEKGRSETYVGGSRLRCRRMNESGPYFMIGKQTST